MSRNEWRSVCCGAAEHEYCPDFCSACCDGTGFECECDVCGKTIRREREGDYSDDGIRVVCAECA